LSTDLALEPYLAGLPYKKAEVAGMIALIDSSQRHFSDFDWLKTYWLFSFADYYDPTNIQFGALRVYNDDVVEPGNGFPTHPHKEMEIITIPLSGSMTHADSMGNEITIETGDVQRMSAGTGLTHSEYNLGTEPVHFYQIWIFPDTLKLNPTYDQRHYHPDTWTNRLGVIASGQGIKDVVTFHADASIYRCKLESGNNVQHEIGDTRRAFLYLTGGDVTVNGVKAEQGDQVRMDEQDGIDIKAEKDAEFILIDVPSCKGYGYDNNTLNGGRWR
jgi:redox-sensitive bicupin YhaK (pirin superfamily)